jgi:hypothetical protein
MKWMEPTRLRGIILALTLGLALAGCSAVKLGYNALPNLSYLWLDGYVDFSEEQAPRMRDELTRLLAWHRQEELPRLLQLLARMEQLAGGEITSQQACGIVAEGRARLKAVTDWAEPGAAEIAATLTGRELRHMQRKFRRNNERFEQDWLKLSPAERHDKRFQLQLERAETIYGRLDAPQRAVLRQRIEQSAWDPARSFAEIQRRQQELLQVLRRISHGSNVPKAEARSLLRAWVGHIEQAPDPGYRTYQETLLQEGCSTFALLHQSTTAEQRDQAVRRLRAYQRDVRDLMAQQP